MTLHDRINGLRGSQFWADEFSAGYNQAKFEAAQLAAQADELMGSLVAALGECQDALDAIDYADEAEYAQTVLDEYRRWRGRE